MRRDVEHEASAQNVLTNNFDPRILSGWGVRPSDWNLGVSLEQQSRARWSRCASRTSAERFAASTSVDNLPLQPADLTPFSIVAPADPRLPGGGGYVVSRPVRRRAGEGRTGRQLRRRAPTGTATGCSPSTAFDVTVNVRNRQGVDVRRRHEHRQTVADNCEVRGRISRSWRRRRPARARSVPVC